MKIKLSSIAYARSGDKGAHSNIGVIFINKKIYKWAIDYLTEDKIVKHFSHILNGKVQRFKLDNLNALNFILYDSLGGGGSESLLNDAQGKTHGQIMLMLVVDIPENIIEGLNE